MIALSEFIEEIGDTHTHTQSENEPLAASKSSMGWESSVTESALNLQV